MRADEKPFIPQPSPGRADGVSKSGSMFLRLRIWWHRRKAKWWYDESIYHRRGAQTHRDAIWQCLAMGNEHRDFANRLEAEATEVTQARARG